MARAQRDSRFRHVLLTAAIQELVTGDAAAGQLALKDYLCATIGLEPLANEMDANVNSLRRMLGPHGNPTLESLRAILRVIQEHEGIQLSIRSHAVA